jgi:hypothetical protein
MALHDVEVMGRPGGQEDKGLAIPFIIFCDPVVGKLL